MGKLDKIKELIEERFERYQTYYQLLGIKSKGVDNAIVEDAYNNKCKQLQMLRENCEKEGVAEEAEEIFEMIQTALDDAYSALKDENSREHYQDILDSIEGVEK